MFCGECGTQNKDGNRFCQSCGTAMPDVAGSSGAQGASSSPPPQPQPVSDGLNIHCMAGPDSGRAFRIGAAQSVLGQCAGITDVGVADQHVWVWYSQGGMQFRGNPQCFVDVNGFRMAEGRLAPGQQFRLGSSTWQVVGGGMPGQAAASENALELMKRKLNQLAGTDRLEGFSLKDMFSEVFKKRTTEEMEDYFVVGTYRTTPHISEVPTGWPKPWLFFRVLVFLVAVYAGLNFMAQHFGNANAIPGMLIMGALAAPLATVILFFELNAPRNVPFHRVLVMVCFGGMISLIISLFGFSSFESLSRWMGAMSAGIIEEIGKLLTVVLLLRKSREKYMLNGLLYGAAVGAGFGFFETAGYAFRIMLETRSLDAATSNLQLRGVLAPFMHVSWTAIAAGALWRVKGSGSITPQVLLNSKFLQVFAIPMVLHMIWNSPVQLPLWTKQLGVGVVGWFILFGMVQQGLRQVKEDQISETRTRIAQTQAGAA